MTSSRIFIVDDEPRMRESLKILLEERGFTVETAENGRDVLPILQTRRFDLFLVDIHMPGMDGFQFMEQVLEHHPDSLLVMMTGQSSVDTAIRALKKGAYDYLRKPFDTADLYKTIDNALAHRAMRQNLKRTKIEYKYMVENSPDLIYQLDPEGRFTFLNRAERGSWDTPRKNSSAGTTPTSSMRKTRANPGGFSMSAGPGTGPPTSWN